jgi:sugar O-acyltransferase (sialic acid O-acetyltransferase NeuD family)
MKNKKLIIFGLQEYAQVMYEYFQYDSDYEVSAFCSYKEYIKSDKLFNLPVVSFDDIEKYSPKEYEFFVAISFDNINKTRQDIYQKFKNMGYKAASYISKKANIWRNVKIGEHVFVAEGSSLQPYVEIGDNVIIWPNCCIAHHTKIGDHSFIAAGTVFGGSCTVGKNCFMGISANISALVNINDFCCISQGAIIFDDLKSFSIVDKNSKISEYDEKVFLKVFSAVKSLANAKKINLKN